MNKYEAKALVENVTNADLKQMFLNAQEQIKDWKEVSRVNKGLTKGAAFNIFTAMSFDDNHFIHDIAKTNMIWEFGEYLPNYQKIQKQKRAEVIPSHQEPKFLPK